MKEKFYKAVTVISCVISVVCIVQINGLKKEIADMSNSLGSQISYINTSVNNISSNVYDAMERNASLLSESGWEYTEIDAENGTVGICLWVTPKEYVPAKTEAEVYINEKAYPMTLANGSFLINADIPLYDLSEIKNVVFTEGENVRTENLDIYISPKNDYFPYVSADFSGSYTEKTEHSINGTINIDMERSNYMELVGVDSVYLIDVLDGKEMNREKINVKFYEENVDYCYGYYEISRTATVPNGSTYKLCTAVVDKNGFVYVNEVNRLELDEDGNAVDDYYLRSDADIYNKNGELLIRGEY